MNKMFKSYYNICRKNIEDKNDEDIKQAKSTNKEKLSIKIIKHERHWRKQEFKQK